MGKEQKSIWFVLGIFVTAAVAFWLGRQSIVQIQIGAEISSDASNMTLVAAAPIEPATTEPVATELASSADSTNGSANETLTEPADATSLETNEDSQSDVASSEPVVGRTVAEERLLADIELAGIEPENLQVYLKAWELLDRDFYGDKPDSTEQLYASIRGLIGSYDDPYTFFIEPKTNEVEQGNLRGSFGGIGAYVESAESGFILRPMRDQPAAKAGIEEGDRLAAVDDTRIDAEMSSDDVVALIRGPLDSKVIIAVERLLEADSETETFENSESKELTFTLIRAEIQTPSMDWRMFSNTEFPSEQWERAADLERIDQIGYIKHHTFSDRTPTEMRTALSELLDSGAEYFILDLRGNPGGPVTAVVQTTDLWVDSGIIMREENAQGTEKLFESTPDTAVGDQPLIIIVDGGSASASEIFAGALQDHQRAIVIGEKTFGKGSVQIIYPLPDKSSVHITSANWFTPDGREINKQGLQPDVVIEPGTDPIPYGIGALLDLEWKDNQ